MYTTQQRQAIQDQNKAIKELYDLLIVQDKEIVKLSGVPGAGKSHCIKVLLEQIVPPLCRRMGVNNLNILTSAISNQATNVSRAFLEGSKYTYESLTFASATHAKPQILDNGTKIFKPQPKYDYSGGGRGQEIPPPIQVADLLIIDECSQISQEDLDLILQLKNPRSKIIFVGDIFQLPPVGASKYSPTFEYDGPNLRIPFRYSGIIQRAAEHLRKEIENGLFKGKNVDKSIVNSFSNIKKSDFICTSNKDYFNKELLKSMTNAGSDLMYSKYISYRKENFMRKAKWIRNKLHSSDYDFEEGDHIVALETYFDDRKGRNIITNSEVDIIDKKRKQTIHIIWVKDMTDNWLYYGFMLKHEVPLKSLASNISRLTGIGLDEINIEEFDYWSIDLKGDKDRKFLPIEPYNIKRYNEILNHIKNDHYYEHDHWPHKWAAFYHFSDFFFKMNYAYGVNSHRAQGSTYNDVFVNVDDIMSVTKNTSLEKLQSLYVSLTRPTNKAFLLKT
jgi:hypothetical protein